MSRWKFVFSVIYRPWKAWISLLFGVISFYDLFLSQFISDKAKSRFPIVADIIKYINWPWHIWVILLLVLMVIFIFEGAFRYLSHAFERPELIELNKLRAKGVQLRNEGFVLLSENSVEHWIENFLHWEEEVINTVSQISPSKAGLIRTLDKWGPQQGYPKAYNARHRQFLQIFDEKLKRLGNCINELSAKS